MRHSRSRRRERRNLVVRGLIVNGASDHPGLEELANRAELARLAPILEIVPDETISSLSVERG